MKVHNPKITFALSFHDWNWTCFSQSFVENSDGTRNLSSSWSRNLAWRRRGWWLQHSNVVLVWPKKIEIPKQQVHFFLEIGKCIWISGKRVADLLVSRINFFSAHSFLVGGWGGHYSSPCVSAHDGTSHFFASIASKKVATGGQDLGLDSPWVSREHRKYCLMEEIRRENQLRLVVEIPWFTQGFFYIPQDFFRQQ